VRGKRKGMLERGWRRRARGIDLDGIELKRKGSSGGFMARALCPLMPNTP
jgi:hypothetical protein